MTLEWLLGKRQLFMMCPLGSFRWNHNIKDRIERRGNLSGNVFRWNYLRAQLEACIPVPVHQFKNRIIGLWRRKWISPSARRPQRILVHVVDKTSICGTNGTRDSNRIVIRVTDRQDGNEVHKPRPHNFGLKTQIWTKHVRVCIFKSVSHCQQARLAQ